MGDKNRRIIIHDKAFFSCNATIIHRDRKGDDFMTRPPSVAMLSFIVFRETD